MELQNSHNETRRQFLAKGAVATVGMFAAGAPPNDAGAQSDGGPTPQETQTAPQQRAHRHVEAHSEEFPDFSRYKPNLGGSPESPSFLGKLVPGFRSSGLPPVPVITPDLETLPWKMVGTVKEFHLVCEHVRREFLPGYWMDVWGYNGSMPGPTIEVTQGDRVRIIVHNNLPEPTTVHWHGIEMPVQYDGVPGVTQDFIAPGGTYVYEFDLHQAGTFFYHAHEAMQETLGMVGLFIIHPKVAWDPPVDRDFALIFQNFFIPPNQTIPDTLRMDWNWHTINGRSGPYTTPLVCKHGERVRIRILDFSPMQHHPIHLHGHTFWITGREGTRIPQAAWQPRNTELIAVAQATDLEFIAYNPGDWVFHCHMTHHMMNHMVTQVGPRIREGEDVSSYLASLDTRPPAQPPLSDPAFRVPGYPQMMRHMHMSHEFMQKIMDRREVRGMRDGWHEAVMGLMTVVRVLPEDLYHQVMHSDDPLPSGISVPGTPAAESMKHKHTD